MHTLIQLSCEKDVKSVSGVLRGQQSTVFVFC